MPYFHSLVTRDCTDFTKRIAAIREMFEETNILLANTDSRKNYGDLYGSKYSHNFLKMCICEELHPAVHKLHAFMRLGSPIGLFPAVESQFYFYFSDFEPTDEVMRLNESEFVERTWVDPEEALTAYEQGSIPIFIPQLMLLTTLKFLGIKSYMQLRQVVSSGFSQNILNYITNKANRFDF